MALIRYFTHKSAPNTMIPTRQHRVMPNGSIFRAYWKPTRAERKAKVAALKAKRGE